MLMGGTAIVAEAFEELKKSIVAKGKNKNIEDLETEIDKEQKFIENVRLEIRRVENMMKSQAASGNSQQRQRYQRQRQKRSDYRRTETGDLNDAYALLCCSSNASDSEVKTAYRKLAREYHPDRVGATGLGEHITHDAVEKFKRINEAYSKIMEARGKK